MSDPKAPFELVIHVAPEEIDELGHVNNVIYLKWVQQVATAHWNVLAAEEDRQRIAWVVLRHEIDYRKPAMPKDAILAKTWVGAANGLSFERHTEFLRAETREILATVRTVWCPINPQTLRPTQVSPAVRGLFSS